MFSSTKIGAHFPKLQEDIYGDTNVTEMNKDLHPGNDKKEDREAIMTAIIMVSTHANKTADED